MKQLRMLKSMMFSVNFGAIYLMIGWIVKEFNIKVSSLAIMLLLP